MIDRKCAVCGEPTFEPLIPLGSASGKAPLLTVLVCPECKVLLGRMFGGKPKEAMVMWRRGDLIVRVIDTPAQEFVTSLILEEEMYRCASGENAPYHPFAVLLCTHINKNLRDLHQEQSK